MQKVYTYEANIKISYSQQNSITIKGNLQSLDKDVSKDEVASYMLDKGWVSAGMEGAQINLNSNAVMGFEVEDLKIADIDYVDEKDVAKALPPENEDSVPEESEEDEEKLFVYLDFKLGKAMHHTLLPVDWDYTSGQEQLESLPYVKDYETDSWVSFLNNRKPKVVKETEMSEEEVVKMIESKEGTNG